MKPLKRYAYFYKKNDLTRQFRNFEDNLKNSIFESPLNVENVLQVEFKSYPFSGTLKEILLSNFSKGLKLKKSRMKRFHIRKIQVSSSFGALPCL